MEIQTLRDLAPKQLERVLSFFARVEAKASFLFAINSAMLGAIAVHIERADFNDAVRLGPLLLSAGGIAISMYFVYRCSFPSLTGGHLSLVYFKEVAKLREQDYIQKFRALTEDQYIDDVLGQAWRNSEILTEKFRTIKIAFIATGLTLLPWTAYLALASISHVALTLR